MVISPLLEIETSVVCDEPDGVSPERCYDYHQRAVPRDDCSSSIFSREIGVKMDEAVETGTERIAHDVGDREPTHRSDNGAMMNGAA